MKEWIKILADVDDEYLTGLSNKGIVKRAHKDMETVAAEILSADEELTVKVGEETVKLADPVGESKCSCPSRTMCRHIVQAILFCQGQLPTAQPNAQPTARPEEAGSEEAQQQEKSSTEAQRQERGRGEALQQEICRMPLPTLKRAMGARAFREFAMQAQAGIEPEITESSVVTVRLPKQEAVVKLLSPLEYSSCTCHKKELCSHKACAVLWYQLKKGVLTAKDLISEQDESAEFDKEQVHHAAGQMKEFLEALYDTGLSRTPSDAEDGLERLALVGHNAGLARYEGYFRGLADSYRKYGKRVASFRIREMMEQTAYLYGQVLCLLRAESSSEIREYAGEFRAKYRPVGDLNLTGVATEHFESQSGYEGETVYFLEEEKKEWYTYTNARPVFYEAKKGRPGFQKAQAPWGLPLSLENLASLRISLADARADERKRLSSTQESRGEIVGPAELSEELLEGWYYEDFEDLFFERILTEKMETDPVFVQPSGIRDGQFDSVQQKFSMTLLDPEGRELVLEVPYSKKEEAAIRYLERFARKYAQGEMQEEEKLPCFFGKLFLKERKIGLSPIAMVKVCAGEGRAVGDRLQRSPEERKNAKDHVPKEDACRALEELLEEIGGWMEEVFQSGFDAVFDSTLEAIARSAELAEQYGMEALSRMLIQLQKGLTMRRHQSGKSEDGMAEVYGNVIEYLYLCRKKLELDSAYPQGTEEH